MSGRKAESKYIIEFVHLMEEWDWEENEKRGLNPSELTQGSGKEPRWVCAKGHKWDTTINHRTSRKSGCPYCSNKRILPGYNDLRSQRPDLMKEWDFAINVIDPSKVGIKSEKKAY
ncbi:MAG: zinc-ribbon domain-containing protein [Lachnospiraceae bacterium]|nr:zinc-ribbon domain-containing protein [Lachnospiraceae bacterium]